VRRRATFSPSSNRVTCPLFPARTCEPPSWLSSFHLSLALALTSAYTHDFPVPSVFVAFSRPGPDDLARISHASPSSCASLPVCFYLYLRSPPPTGPLPQPSHSCSREEVESPERSWCGGPARTARLTMEKECAPSYYIGTDRSEDRDQVTGEETPLDPRLGSRDSPLDSRVAELATLLVGVPVSVPVAELPLMRDGHYNASGIPFLTHARRLKAH
jgi:hypothetical protein